MGYLAVLPVLLLLLLGYVGWWGWVFLRSLTFLPAPVPVLPVIPDVAPSYRFATPWYRLEAWRDGPLRLLTADGRPLLEGWVCCVQWREPGEGALHTAWIVPATSAGEDGEVRQRAATPFGELRLRLRLTGDSPQVAIEVEAEAARAVEVVREALVLQFHPPVTEVYTKEGRLEAPPRRREYWLGREGALFGAGAASAHVYHTPRVSSLQLDPPGRRLWVNLEHAHDHPLHWLPLADEERGVGQVRDLAAERCRPGRLRGNGFTLRLGAPPALRPRLLHTPQGRAATYIFNEHGCYTDVRLHRAVYFGSERIERPEEASGGFVRHGIPVTKSVFYANACGARNDETCPGFATPVASLRDTPELLTLVDQLHASGLVEVCLHGVQNRPASAELEAEALDFMTRRYGMVSWIDHRLAEGWLNHPALLGEVPPPPLWEAWRRLGVRAFWNPAREYLPLSAEIRQRLVERHPIRDGEGGGPLPRQRLPLHLALRVLYVLLSDWDQRYPDLLKGRYGQCLPTPVWWRHPATGPDHYHWATQHCCQGVMTRWLGRLVADRGIFINHCYPSAVQGGDLPGPLRYGCWTLGGDGVARSSRALERYLARLARWRAEGRLHLTTMREGFAYWLGREAVTLAYPAGGGVVIRNDGAETVAGLTLALPVADDFRLEGATYHTRRLGGERLAWFDLPAGAEVRLWPVAHPAGPVQVPTPTVPPPSLAAEAVPLVRAALLERQRAVAAEWDGAPAPPATEVAAEEAEELLRVLMVRHLVRFQERREEEGEWRACLTLLGRLAGTAQGADVRFLDGFNSAYEGLRGREWRGEAERAAAWQGFLANYAAVLAAWLERTRS